MTIAAPNSMPAPWVTLHPAEIASREFPRARKGYEPDAVRAWLRAIAAATEAMQSELAHVRAERDRLEALVRRAAEEPAASAVRTSLMQARLRRRPGGYSRAEVEALLEAAAAEIARLETRAAVLEAEASQAREANARQLDLVGVVARLEAEVARIHSRIPTMNGEAR